MIPMVMTPVTRRLPLSRRPIGLALFGITATLAPTLGPTVGGWLTELYGWPFAMAYNDAFLVLGLSLLMCILVVWLGKRVVGGTGGGEAAH